MSPDALSIEVGRGPDRRWLGVRCLLPTGLVRPVTVVVLGVGEEHRLKMPAIDDEQPVQDFAAQRPD